MANREWMFSLSNEELTEFILTGMNTLKSESTNTRLHITKWLDKEHDENPPIMFMHNSNGEDVEYVKGDDGVYYKVER